MSFIEEKWDDIVYLCLLLTSILLGSTYRKIECPEQRKWFGSSLGIGLVVAVSGINAIHAVLSSAIGIVLIYSSGKRKCHVATFIFMFLYLFFFRALANFGLPVPSGHTNLIQMILTLKLVGLAFEINGSYLAQGKAKKEEKIVIASEEYEKDEDYDELIDPKPIEIIHYLFNYIGILTGPYFRYRTYSDFIYCKYYEHADCTKVVLDRLKYIPMHVAILLMINYVWPVNYILTEEFSQRSLLYKIMIIWPLFTAFRHRIYTGLKLAECVCISAGLGSYPTAVKSRYGHGPKFGYRKLKELNDTELSKCTYDFETIKSTDAWDADFIPTYRDSMKAWNMCVQYWMGMYIFRRFPIKPLRVHVTLLISTIWHGWYAGYFFCIYMTPFYLVTEDIFYRLLLKDATGIKHKIWSFVFWFARLHYQSYGTVAFLLLYFSKFWVYYSMMYHYPYIIWAILLIVGLAIQVSKKRPNKTNIEEKKEKLTAAGIKEEIPVK